MELIRLDKPTGTILMFWPLAIALHSYAYKLIECFVGAFIIRSSACTVNDIFDMNVDAGVERTKNRPLPSGRITVLAATVFLLVQYALGILFFYLTIDGLAFAIYPLLKRVTYWPQAWLGFAMNFGFVTAYVSTANTFNYDILCCALAAYTIYACQDIIDDVKTGVLSTAILFGTWIRPMLVGCAMIFIAMLSVAGYLNRQDWGYFVFSVCGTATHLIWQFNTVELDKPESCWKNFKRNGQLGWIVWGGLLIDYTSKSATFLCS
ncbi:UbiA prenyltransferase family [Armillaria mellea]|nr:UbiA prenyltransferase family [Armillaria mellea]